MSLNRQPIDRLFIDRDPEDPQQGWGWLEVYIEAIKAHGIPRKPPSPRTKPDGRRINFPSRGRAGTKKFSLRMGKDLVMLNVQKSLTVKAVCAWVKTWAPANTQIISPGGYIYGLDGEALSRSKVHCVYFILNSESNAIKIGRARDIEKRLRSLQTASPVELELLRTIQVESESQAQVLERKLHVRFEHLRLKGEWFKAEPELLSYIATGVILSIASL